MRDPHSGDSRGFGFVKMVAPEQADAAREALQGQVHEGRTLSIEKARRGRPRTPTPGKYYGPPKRGILDLPPPSRIDPALRRKIRTIGPYPISRPPWQRSSRSTTPTWDPPPSRERVDDYREDTGADDFAETRGFRGGRYGGDRYEERRGGGYGRRDDYSSRGGRDRYRDRYDDREFYGSRYGPSYRDREDYGRGVDRYASGPPPRGEDRYGGGGGGGGGGGRGDDRRGYYGGRDDRGYGDAAPRDGGREPYGGGGRGGYDDRGASDFHDFPHTSYAWRGAPLFLDEAYIRRR